MANVAAELAAQMRRLPIVANVVSGGDARSARSCGSTRAGISRSGWGYRPRACRKPSASRPSAMSDRRWRNSTPATGQFPSACCSRKTPAPTSKSSNRSACRRQRGGGVPLVALADIELRRGPDQHRRYDRQRQASVEADLVGGAALSERDEGDQALPVMKSLPPASRSAKAATPSCRPSCSTDSAGRCATA